MAKKKLVVIIIEVPMNNTQSDQWGLKSDYFQSSVNTALESIIDMRALKSCEKSIDTGEEVANYKLIIN